MAVKKSTKFPGFVIYQRDSQLPQTANVRLQLEFLRIENKQIKTVPNDSYGWNCHKTTYFCVEAIKSKRKIRGKLGHVVQIHVFTYYYHDISKWNIQDLIVTELHDSNPVQYLHLDYHIRPFRRMKPTEKK